MAEARDARNNLALKLGPPTLVEAFAMKLEPARPQSLATVQAVLKPKATAEAPITVKDAIKAQVAEKFKRAIR